MKKIKTISFFLLFFAFTFSCKKSSDNKSETTPTYEGVKMFKELVEQSSYKDLFTGNSNKAGGLLLLGMSDRGVQEALTSKGVTSPNQLSQEQIDDILQECIVTEVDNENMRLILLQGESQTKSSVTFTERENPPEGTRVLDALDGTIVLSKEGNRNLADDAESVNDNSGNAILPANSDLGGLSLNGITSDPIVEDIVTQSLDIDSKYFPGLKFMKEIIDFHELRGLFSEGEESRGLFYFFISERAHEIAFLGPQENGDIISILSTYSKQDMTAYVKNLIPLGLDNNVALTSGTKLKTLNNKLGFRSITTGNRLYQIIDYQSGGGLSAYIGGSGINDERAMNLKIQFPLLYDSSTRDGVYRLYGAGSDWNIVCFIRAFVVYHTSNPLGLKYPFTTEEFNALKKIIK